MVENEHSGSIMSDPESENSGILLPVRRAFGGVVMEAAEINIDRIIDVPEISETKRRAFVTRDPDALYLLGCADDRSLTPESKRELEELGIENPETFVRYYGATIGAARVAGVAIIEQYGSDALEVYEGDFEKLVADIAQRIEATSKLKVTVHSAESNEGNPAHLCESDNESGLGCAYAKLLGGVIALNADDSTRSTAKQEARGLTQAKMDAEFDRIVEANRQLAHIFSFDPSTGLDRVAFRRLGFPSMILAGDHATIQEDQVKTVINFKSDVISNPNMANMTDEPFYNNDVTIVAETLMRALPEFALIPRKLLTIMVEDIAATRQALASMEDLQAPDLKLERYGSYEDAVVYLETLRV